MIVGFQELRNLDLPNLKTTNIIGLVSNGDGDEQQHSLLLPAHDQELVVVEW